MMRSLLALLLLAGVLLSGACGKEKPAAPAPGPEKGGTPPPPPPTETPAPERRPTVLAKADASGAPFSGLKGPRDAALDEKGRLWVADFGHNTIQIFDAAGGILGGWGSRGSAEYGLKDPCGISVRGDDVYVADTWNGRVERFSTSGELKGKAPTDFYGPRGVAAGPDGKVWISDTGNKRVVACSRDLSNPKEFGKSGKPGEDFGSPIGIAVGPGGSVYVADPGHKKIQVLDSEGRFKAAWTLKAWEPSSEAYLEVDSDGTVYATDPSAHAVLQIDRKGNETRRWTEDSAGQKFHRPTGIALDSKKRLLYVVNTDSGVISTVKLSGKP